MSGGRKRILSPFTGRKKRKVWNKTTGKYMLEENRQNLAGTDRGSYYNQEEWLQEFLNDKVAMVAKVVIVKMMIRIILKI